MQTQSHRTVHNPVQKTGENVASVYWHVVRIIPSLSPFSSAVMTFLQTKSLCDEENDATVEQGKGQSYSGTWKQSDTEQIQQRLCPSK